ncbi:MAG: hypothetical protein ACK587_07405 [Cyanobacteriota bacterium]
MKFSLFLAPALGIGLAAAEFPAHAFLTQTVAAPVAFTTTGNGILNTTAFQFPPFTKAPVASLVAAQLKFSTAPTITGTATAGFFIAPSTGLFSGTIRTQPTIYFTSIPIPPFNAAFTGVTADSAQIAPFSCTIGEVCYGSTSAFTPYSSAFPPIGAGIDPAFQKYLADGPFVAAFKTAYTFVGSDESLAFGTSNMQFQGQLMLEYAYVPGPIPILGVGAGLAWSRRLKKRLRSGK